MRTGPLADIGHLDRQAIGPTASHLNDRGTVELDPATMLVCKQFREPDPAELARREFDYLRRFSAALAGQPFLRCPQPLRADLGLGKVWMTYCSGSQLHHLAEESLDIEDHLDHIARQIAIAVERYVAEFDEPYYGLAAWNMLYDAPTQTLSLVDFSGAGRGGKKLRSLQQAPVDVSLGCLIGTATYHTVRLRRASWRKKEYWQRQEQLMCAVLDQMNARHDLQPALIQDASQVLYDAIGKRRGRPLRRLWFRTIGQALFNRRSNAIVARLTPGAALDPNELKRSN